MQLHNRITVKQTTQLVRSQKLTVTAYLRPKFKPVKAAAGGIHAKLPDRFLNRPPPHLQPKAVGCKLCKQLRQLAIKQRPRNLDGAWSKSLLAELQPKLPEQN